MNLLLTIILGLLGIIASTDLTKSKVPFKLSKISVFKLIIVILIVVLTIISSIINYRIESENGELQRKLLIRTSQTERVIFQEWIELYKDNPHSFEMKIPSLSEVEISGFDAELVIVFGVPGFTEFDIPNTKEKAFKIKVPSLAIGEKSGETMWEWKILHKCDTYRSYGTIKVLSTIDTEN